MQLNPLLRDYKTINLYLFQIYPSVDDVRLSLEGYPAGTSLPYNKETAARQPYFNTFLQYVII